jgi:hypothetical protein
LTETSFRTGYNNENDKLEKEKEKNTDTLEDVDHLNIVNNDNESIIDNNTLLSTGKKEMANEEKIKLREDILNKNIQQ